MTTRWERFRTNARDGARPRRLVAGGAALLGLLVVITALPASATQPLRVSLLDPPEEIRVPANTPLYVEHAMFAPFPEVCPGGVPDHQAALATGTNFAFSIDNVSQHRTHLVVNCYPRTDAQGNPTIVDGQPVYDAFIGARFDIVDGLAPGSYAFGGAWYDRGEVHFTEAVRIIAEGTAAPPAAPDGPYLDVPSTSVHAPGITELTDMGIAGGYPDGTFRPSEPVTRAQMATFLARALQLDTTQAGTFSDVPAGSVHAGAIAAVAARGITTGYADGTFRPGQPVTRDQMASFLYRALWPATTTAVLTFPDVDPTGPHATAIAVIADAGITTGYADGSFRPGQPVTRDQMASFLSRARGFIEEAVAAG